MEKAVTERIEQQVRSAFPDGAIARVQVLQHGDDPEVEPGQTAMRVWFDWPGRSDGKLADPKTVHAFVVANGAALEALRDELPSAIRWVEFRPESPAGAARPHGLAYRITDRGRQPAAPDDSTPVMTRLGPADLAVLDGLITAGIVNSRAEGVRWAISRLREHPAVPDSADWQRHWTIDAGAVALEPVTRRMAQGVLDGGPITARFENGSLHDRIPQAMGIAIRDIDSGTAAVLPTVWLVVRRADRRILGDIGTHGPPDHQGCVEIGYSLAPSARGQGIGTAAVSALVKRLAAIPPVRQVTAVTGASNTASRHLLERLGFHLSDRLPATDEVRYTLNLR